MLLRCHKRRSSTKGIWFVDHFTKIWWHLIWDSFWKRQGCPEHYHRLPSSGEEFQTNNLLLSSALDKNNMNYPLFHSYCIRRVCPIRRVAVTINNDSKGRKPRVSQRKEETTDYSEEGETHHLNSWMQRSCRFLYVWEPNDLVTNSFFFFLDSFWCFLLIAPFWCVLKYENKVFVEHQIILNGWPKKARQGGGMLASHASTSPAESGSHGLYVQFALRRKQRQRVECASTLSTTVVLLL